MVMGDLHRQHIISCHCLFMFQSRPGGTGWSTPPPPPPPPHPPTTHTHHSSHHHSHSSHYHSSHPHHPSQPAHHSINSQSLVYIPHPLSVGHYDLPQDTYFVDTNHSDPYTPPPSHLPPPNTDAQLNPETSRFINLMSVPYADHHAHISLSFYSKSSIFGAHESFEPKRYNFETDVGGDQISLRRKLSFPYFYSPVVSRSSVHSPILHSHLHSSDVVFPSSLTNHDDDLSSHSSNHSLELGCTENDDVIMMSGSRDNHVIELPELRQPAVRISDSVLPYFKMSPFSPPPPAHTTPQSQITPVTDTSDDVIASTDGGPQEMGSATDQSVQIVSADNQHRLDFQNGRIDYTGIDSFENIQRRLDTFLDEAQVVEQGEALTVKVEERVEEEGLVEEEKVAVTVESCQADA